MQAFSFFYRRFSTFAHDCVTGNEKNKQRVLDNLKSFIFKETLKYLSLLQEKYKTAHFPFNDKQIFKQNSAGFLLLNFIFSTFHLYIVSVNSCILCKLIRLLNILFNTRREFSFLRPAIPEISSISVKYMLKTSASDL